MPPCLIGKAGPIGSRAQSRTVTLLPRGVTDLKNPTLPLMGTSEGGRPTGKKRVLPRTNGELFQQVKPEYYFENGLRKVRPYYFEYQTYAKERWLGRSILDVFLKEFRDRPARYYQEAIQQQLITLNGQPCELDTLVGSSDLLAHRLHRHEPPVTATPIRILHDGEGMLVVDKPASIPAHPSGRYRFNSLVEILRHETGHSHLSIINRLDRLTSGICVLATSPEAAEALHRRMEDRQLQKEYLARVTGHFPERAECQEPLCVVEHKLGLVTVDRARGKPSQTIFERVATNGRESIVRCRPLTGRTHQIRVHLCFLGHPIVNDHLYNNRIWQNIQPDPSGADDRGDSVLTRHHHTEAEIRAIARQLLDETMVREGSAFDEALLKGDSICPECELDRPDPTPDQLCIYLHASKYSAGDDWSFQTDSPEWSKLEE